MIIEKADDVRESWANKIRSCKTLIGVHEMHIMCRVHVHVRCVRASVCLCTSYFLITIHTRLLYNVRTSCSGSMIYGVL